MNIFLRKQKNRFFRLYHHLSSYSLKQNMATAIQIFVIFIIICLPMISIAALVFTLTTLYMSFGIKRFYVKILSFVFDYATKIKKDKEIPINSDIISTESTTPQFESLIIKKSFDDSIELSPDISINNESKIESTTDDDLDNSQNQSTSRISLQNDIQFKLSKNFKNI
jgi:hypothetical protein